MTDVVLKFHDNIYFTLIKYRKKEQNQIPVKIEITLFGITLNR